MSGFIRTIAILGICSVSAMAQFYPSNARMNALGGTFIIQDRSDILRYAAYMNDYKNDVMANFKNAPILGVKSFGETVNLGIIANRGMLISGSGFYSAASSRLDQLANGPGIGDTSQFIPHVLLGINADAIKLGFDFFFEYSHASYSTTAPEVDVWQSMLNPGVIASAIFGSEEVPIALKLGIGFPMINGSREAPPAQKIEYKSDRGIYGDVGAEVGFPIGPVQGKVGTDLILDTYKFEGQPTSYLNIRSGSYFGITSKIFTDGVVGLMYSFDVLSGNDDDSATDTQHHYNDFAQVISAGIENNWSSVWFFDKVAARGGLSYVYGIPVSKTNTPNNDTRIKYASMYGPLNPTVGLGVAKGPFQLDMSINLAAWANLVNGPGVGQITASLDF